jgi:MFS family permease
VTGGILADMFNWRTAFLIAGTPGILLALLVALTLKDPRANPAARAGRPPQRPIRECLAELRRTRIFWWICAGSAAKGMISYGQIAFLGSFFLRVHAEGLAALSTFVAETLHIRLGPLALVGLGLGLITAVGAVLGTWLGGRLGDRIARRNMAALLLIPTIASPLAVPLHIGAFLAPSAWMSMLLLVPPGLLGAMWLGPTFAALQSVVHPDNRSTAAAIQASLVLLIGLGLGPLIVGSVSDLLSGAGLGEAQGVRWALVVISCVGLVAGALFFGASRRLKESLIS